MMISSVIERYKVLGWASLCVVSLLLISSCSTSGSLVKKEDTQGSVALDQSSPASKPSGRITSLETQDDMDGTKILI